MPNENQDIATALADYAKMAQNSLPPFRVDGATHPYAVVPNGYKVETLERLIFNEYSMRPHRVRQNVSLLEPASFAEYWQAFKDPDSRIFADRDAHKFLAVLDYHEPPDLPRWNSHTATLQLKHTEEWLTWTGSDDKQMGQAAFALFMEDNAPDIYAATPEAPSAATMMEIARTLQAQEESVFDSAVRLDNGSMRLQYRTDVTATAGTSGNLSVPQRFTIRIAVFEGSVPVDIQVRLRYRIPSGKLSLWYSLWRPHIAERDAFNAVATEIGEKCGPVLIGKP